jgi:hypothetical protein
MSAGWVGTSFRAAKAERCGNERGKLKEAREIGSVSVVD